MEGLRKGDRGVFPEIVQSCQELVYNTVLGIVQQAEDAEDVTQEVFVQVYESLHSFRQEAKLTTWIYRIAVTKALDFEKKKKRQKRGGLLRRIFNADVEEEAVHFDHPGLLLDKKQHGAALFNAINRLPEKQRIAFLLHKLESLSYQEIADVMDTSMMAVESLQLRAKKNLRKLLHTYYNRELL